MSVTMELRENDRVIYYRVSGSVSLADLIPLYQQNQAIRENCPYKIHVIANISRAPQFHIDILNARLFSPDVKHPRAGYVFLVGCSPYVRSIVDIAIRLLNVNQFQFLGTEEAAWAAVREIIGSENY